MIVQKLNESFSVIDADQETLKKIFNFLKIERPGAYFDDAVKKGFKSPFEFFTSIQNKKLLVFNGHLSLLKSFGVSVPEIDADYLESELDFYLSKIFLPFEPHDFQISAFKESILYKKQLNKMATGSGKSLTIALIADFFRTKNKKGLLLVPNINLLEQFKNDIKDYNLVDLYNNTHIIGGGENKKHFDKPLTISTWQSLCNWHDKLDELDFIICDESHRFASTETSDIVQKTINCKYKLGFTGTIPEDPIQKMQLIGLFGLPKTYITARELIQLGLATPVKINTIFLEYSNQDKKIFHEIKPSGRSKNKYPIQQQFIKEHVQRNEFIVNLISKLRSKGNTLILGQHVDHLKTMYLRIMGKLYPDVKDIKNSQITGKKSFKFQEQYGVYYISGSDDSKTRELTRKILEEDLYSITLEDDSVIRLHGNKEIKLIDGTKKLVKDLMEDDEIDDSFINKNIG